MNDRRSNIGDFSGAQAASPQARPRLHPSAKTAIGLGVLSVLCAGPIAGVPAIVIARKALSETADAPDQYGGASYIKIGLGLGYLGCFLGIALLFGLFVTQNVGLGVCIVLIGLGIGALSVWGTREALPAWVGSAARFTRQRTEAPVFAAALVVGGVGGLVARVSEQRASARECDQQREAVGVAVEGGRLDQARAALTIAERRCDASKSQALTAMQTDLAAREASSKRARDAAAREEAARVRAEAEKSAALEFPVLAKRAEEQLRSAGGKMGQGRWRDAAELAETMRGDLVRMKGTAVAASAAWKDLMGKVDALDAKLKPQLERLELKEEEKRQRARIQEERAMLDALLSEYQDNEVRADARFKGRTVEFSGVADAIGKDILDSIYVTVGHGQWLETPIVQCFFDDKHGAAAAQLSKGSRVRMRGRVAGLTLMHVIVKECEFIE